MVGRGEEELDVMWSKMSKESDGMQGFQENR